MQLEQLPLLSEHGSLGLGEAVGLHVHLLHKVPALGALY